MKFSSLFSIILVAHIGLIGLLLVQPGCKSKTSPGPAEVQAPAIPQSTPRQPAASTRNLSEPTRPVGSSQYNTTSPSGRDNSMEAFNAPGVLSPVTGPDDALLMPDSNGPASTRVYVVRPGDTLSGIARREGVSLNALLDANGLNRNSTIYAKQELTVPTAAGGSVTMTSATATSPTSGGSEYVVKSGDSLLRIATRNGITLAQLKAANNLSRDTIFVGQKLTIPDGGGNAIPSAASSDAGASASTSTPRTSSVSTTSSGGTYTVVSGDSPIVIARKLGVNANELMQLNNVADPRRLSVGQVLQVPGKSGQSSSATPASAASVNSVPASTSSAAPRIQDATRQTEILPAAPAAQPSALEALDALEADDLPYVEVENVGAGNN